MPLLNIFHVLFAMRAEVGPKIVRKNLAILDRTLLSIMIKQCPLQPWLQLPLNDLTQRPEN